MLIKKVSTVAYVNMLCQNLRDSKILTFAFVTKIKSFSEANFLSYSFLFMINLIGSFAVKCSIESFLNGFKILRHDVLVVLILTRKGQWSAEWSLCLS